MKRIRIDRWKSDTVLYTCTQDPYDADIQKTTITDWFLETRVRYAIEEAPYVYEISNDLYSTCYECLVKRKIKVCRNELEGAKDSIGWAIDQLKGKLK